MNTPGDDRRDYGFLACFRQFPPHLRAGVKHSDEYAQYPKPPCVVQVCRMFRAPSHTDGAGDARVRCAVSIGAVLDADHLANESRGLAAWIGAGQFHHVLETQATLLPSGGGATFSKTLDLGGAAIDRARFTAMFDAELPFAVA